MMPASRKADLIFEHVRHQDGSHTGTMTVPSLHGPAAFHEGLFTHEAWVSFVVEQIRRAKKTPTVAFVLSRSDGARHESYLDPRTVEQIRVQSLTAEDLTL